MFDIFLPQRRVPHVLMQMTRERGRKLYAQAKEKGTAPLNKSAVPQPLDEDRSLASGACLYACQEGHVWVVFLKRALDDQTRWLPCDPSQVYCVEEPCADEETDDDDALGVKVSGTRHWKMR
jgi:hypothetical protein